MLLKLSGAQYTLLAANTQVTAYGSDETGSITPPAIVQPAVSPRPPPVATPANQSRFFYALLETGRLNGRGGQKSNENDAEVALHGFTLGSVVHRYEHNCCHGRCLAVGNSAWLSSNNIPC